MAAVDTINAMIGSESQFPMSSRAAMNTKDQNPNVHYAHETRDWVVAIGNSPHEEYEVIVRRCRDGRRVGALLVLPESPPSLPARLASSASGEFVPASIQCRILLFLLEGPKTMTQLKNKLGTHIYDKPHGVAELRTRGLINRVDGKMALTEEGRDVAEEAAADEEDK